MFYVYILKNKEGDIYIGFHLDLKKRIQDHNLGKVYSTKNKGPYQLIYYEAYKSKKDALLREKRLKYYGRSLSQLKRRIRDSLFNA